MVKKRRSFSREFKLEAVGLMTEGGAEHCPGLEGSGDRRECAGPLEEAV